MPLHRRHCSWKEFIGQVLDKYDEYQSRPEVTISAERHLLTCHWEGDYVSLKLIPTVESITLNPNDQDSYVNIADQFITSAIQNCE